MPHYLFVTGRLAERPLRGVVARLASEVGFEYSIAVMPITVAALITPRWLARRLEAPEGISAVILPGHCRGDLAPVEEAAGVPVRRGPVDLRELPGYFGRPEAPADYGEWDIEIIARIDRADELSIDEILDRAASLADDAADVVLLGGSGRPWPDLAAVVRELREEGRRVAVGDVAPLDLLSAFRCGIELVLPANPDQQEAAAGLGCEVVLRAGQSSDDEFFRTVEKARQRGIRHRIDAGLCPIGLGLAESVGRYLEVRRRWPDAELMMSLEAVTQTTAVDSAPLHLLLLGLCQELRAGSVLVGQEANWNRTAVRECHLARQLTHYVTRHKTPALDAEPGLLMLRDAAALEFGHEELEHLAETLKDPTPRLYAENGRLHAVTAGKHLESDDAYDLFDRILAGSDRSFDARQAFYLGYESAKAVIALTLGKTYRQDEALNWGTLTRRELTRLERRALRLARLREECGETQQYFEEGEADGPFEESHE